MLLPVIEFGLVLRHSVKSVIIESGVTRIGNEAFAFSLITSITIPEGVTSIGDMAFYSCKYLESINIPESVTTIGNQTFDRCEKLTSINIPENVVRIGHFAFWNCINLTTLNFNAINCNIASRLDWTNLTQVTIGNNVQTIPPKLFYNCKNITLLTLPESITNIGDEAFYGCGLTSIIIPSGVINIGDMAFYGCGLTSVTIPNSVENIGNMAFFSSTLASINVESENANYSSDNGVLFNKDKTMLIQFPISKTGNYVIPNGVTSIDADAFVYSKLTSITIPASMENIESPFTFESCHFTSVIFLNPIPVTTPPLYGCTVYVPSGSKIAYQNAFNCEWCDIYIVELITFSLSENSALIEWQPIENAEGYRIIIYSDEVRTNIICTLEFNAAGELISVSRARSTMQTASTNFSYTVENLQSGKDYYYTLEILGVGNVVLASLSDMFTTDETTGIVETLRATSLPEIIGYCSISGQKLPKEPVSGVYIIMYSNGKTEKAVR